MAYTEQEARKLVLSAGKRLTEMKLIARTWGNISARISDEEFIITPSGRAYETLAPEDLVKVRIDDLSYAGTVKPSSEKGIHASAYQFRRNVNFVVHTHQFYASALSAGGRDFPFAPCASYGLPGSKKLRQGVIDVMTKYPDNKAFLMEKHGAFLLGETDEEAFRIAEELETLAKETFLKAVPAEGLPVSSATGEPSFLMRYSESRDELRAYIDDFAQLIGPGVKLAKGQGFLRPFDAYSKEDAEAVEMIAEKNAAAALYADEEVRLASTDAVLQRVVYLTKYSKLKNKK